MTKPRVIKRLTILSIILMTVGCSHEPEFRQSDQVNATEEPEWVDEIRNSTFNLNDLPPDIVQELTDYLNLEFGAPDFSIPIETDELSYLGEFEELGKPIRIWKYSCGNENICYVAVQPFGDSYMIGMAPIRRRC